MTMGIEGLYLHILKENLPVEDIEIEMMNDIPVYNITIVGRGTYQLAEHEYAEALDKYSMEELEDALADYNI